MRPLALALLVLACAGRAHAQQRDAQGRTVIPEIDRLRDRGVIPPDVYARYDSRAIGEAIVARVARTMKTPSATEPFSPYNPVERVAFDAKTQATLQIYFPLERAAEIVRDGFLNIHQAPNIYAQAGRSDWRADIEDNLARLRLEKGVPRIGTASVANEVRPKYAILDVELGAELVYETRGGQRYGSLVAVLKPDVLRRATYTPFDSGAMSSGNAYTDSNRLKKEVRTLDEPWLYHAGRFKTGEPAYSEYFEAQIWGKVDRNDVREFWVPPGTDARTIAVLKGAGVPVREYVEVKENGRYRRVARGALDRAVPGGALRREARGALTFLGAYATAEAIKGDWRSLRAMASPEFARDLAAFTASSHATDALLRLAIARPALQILMRSWLPLTVGIGVVQFLNGAYSARDHGVAAGSFLVSGSVMHHLFGTPRTVAGGVAHLAVVLLGADTLERAVTQRTSRGVGGVLRELDR